MTEVKEQVRMSAWDLYKAIDRFVSDNTNHRELEQRHLAVSAVELRAMAYDLGSNGVRTYQEKYREPLAAMRLREIDAERQKLASTDARLRAEADKLLGKASAA